MSLYVSLNREFWMILPFPVNFSGRESVINESLLVHFRSSNPCFFNAAMY